MAHHAAPATGLAASDEDAWRWTPALNVELVQTVSSTLERYWQTHNALPKQQAMATWGGMQGIDITANTKYVEDNRGWFEMCLEAEYLPEALDRLRAVKYGHKKVLDVDFGALYGEAVQAQQVQEAANPMTDSVISMPQTAPGQFWMCTPRIALKLMASAENLSREFGEGGDCFGGEFSHGVALKGEARDAWAAQGPIEEMVRRDMARERGWYWRVRDCFTAIAQRIAVGNNPRPRTYAELWACCLVFDVAEGTINDELHMNEELGDKYDALPVSINDDDMSVTRVSLLGPYTTATLPPRPLAGWFDPIATNLFQSPVQ